MDCISVENMRQSDAYTIAHYVSGRELMFRAAQGVFRAVSWFGKTAIVVGSGNNGGDGYALAGILKDHGLDCAIFQVSKKVSADSQFYYEKAQLAGIPISPYVSGCLDGYQIIVDCLLGTGFQGRVRDNYRLAIEEINATDAYVISVDINSGMNGDTAEADLAVQSDLTVTIGYVKNGLILENAGKYIKRLVCTDIGIVLLKEEGKITAENCPPWLDMNIQKAY